MIGSCASLLRSADAAAREGHIAKIERDARVAQGVVDALMAIARGESVRAEPVSISSAMAEARKDSPEGL
ncbi:MAG TPA: hypothetical protein VGH87_26210, partial [Polyangiaceae bacterium]